MDNINSKAETKKIIGEVLTEIVESVKYGNFKKTKIGLMVYGSELGEEELLKGAFRAMQNDPSIEVVPIGPKLEGYENYEWIETQACESEVSEAMEKALRNGEIEGAVALHYPFPLGIITIGRIITPAKGNSCFIASSTGSSSANRVEAMIRNAILAIATAKANGIANPTIGILNLDGARTALRALQKLNENGYKINFVSSARKDGGAILRGNDLLIGVADICVTDTLTGNVLMKLFSAWNTGGNFESVGWGYGPSVGDGWDKVVSIISRVSGAPVVANALSYNAKSVRNELSTKVREELVLAQKAGLDEIINSISSRETVENPCEVKAPEKETTDEELQGIDVLEIENAVITLWKAGVYAESSMGCTGPVVKFSSSKKEMVRKILKENGYI